MRKAWFVLLIIFVTTVSVKCLAASTETHPAPLIHTLAIPEDGRSYNTPDAEMGPSILLANDRLFYQDGVSGPLRAFDAETLKPLWSWPAPRTYPRRYLYNIIKNFPLEIVHEDYNYHLYEWSIVLWEVEGGIIKAKTYNPRHGGTFICGVDVITGELKWTNERLVKGVSRRTNPIKSAVIKDLVIRASFKGLRAYSPNSDQTKWQIEYDYQQGKIVRHTIAKTTSLNDPTNLPLIWGLDDKIFCVDALSGQILWMEVPIPGLRPVHPSDGYIGFGNRVVEPIDDIVYFQHNSRRSDSVLLAFDVKKRSLLWEYRGSYRPFVHDDVDVIVTIPGPIGHRGLVCLDAKTGEQKWECTLFNSRIAGLATSDRIIYCCDSRITENYTYEGYVYAIDRATGTIIWKYKADERFAGNPVLYKNRVYVLSTKAERDPNGIIRVFDHNISLQAVNRVADTTNTDKQPHP